MLMQENQPAPPSIGYALSLSLSLSSPIRRETGLHFPPNPIPSLQNPIPIFALNPPQTLISHSSRNPSLYMAFPRAKVLNPHHRDDQLHVDSTKKLNRRDNQVNMNNTTTASPIKYLPLQRVYSATTQYSSSSCGSSTARVWTVADRGEEGDFRVYRRRSGGKRMCYFEMMTARQEVKEGMSVEDGDGVRGLKKAKIEACEGVNYNGDLSNGIQLRHCRNSGASVQKKRKRADVSEKVFCGQTSVKRWVG